MAEVYLTREQAIELINMEVELGFLDELSPEEMEVLIIKKTSKCLGELK